MKCPHCNYEHKEETWDASKGLWTDVVGDESFFSLPVKMEQVDNWRGDITRNTLYACPKCCKTFIDGDN